MNANGANLPFRKTQPAWVMVRLCMVLLGLCSGSSSFAQTPVEPAIREIDRQHWSFQKPIRPLLPSCRNPVWVRNPIDRFVLARLEAKGLSPNPPAEHLPLLRRVCFDLTGLPPTPDEIEQFLAECRADADRAYEKLVDRLLASPHYGERWAQHWLDVVRYAESNGYETDGERPSAWRYRDYVVRSLNDDKPFDRFLTEQIAGDELAAGKDARAQADLWIATGMNRCGPAHVGVGNIDPEVIRNEQLTEMVMGVGSAFLGLTMNCARCHDHKFDPISQADYYRLEAFFASTRPKDVDFSTPEERNGHQLKLLATVAKIAPIKAQVAALDAPYQNRLREMKRVRLELVYREALDSDPKKRTPEQEKRAKEAQTLIKVTWDEILAAMTPADRERRARLRAEQHVHEAELPMPPSQAWAIADDGKPVATHLLVRGEVKNKGAVVEPGFARVLNGQRETNGAKKLTRLDLAKWLTETEQPLTARVLVNRLWQHHFGRGIVGTPNDFGARGERPTHPELLDWLAVEFMEGGWKIKPLHRLMVLSATYRQSSAKGEGGGRKAELDPDNKLLGRMNRHRLEGETLRDAILAASGTLNRDLGGPMIRIPLEPEVYDLIFTEGEPDGLWPVTADVKQHSRRSLYLFAKRNVRQPLLEAFDQPDRLTPCAVRGNSTFAPQALILMNGRFTQERSRALAELLVRESRNDPDQWINIAYRRCFGRDPGDAERQLGREFLKDQTATILKSSAKDKQLATTAALADYCLALFNSNEFIYVK